MPIVKIIIPPLKFGLELERQPDYEITETSESEGETSNQIVSQFFEQVPAQSVKRQKNEEVDSVENKQVDLQITFDLRL